MSAPFFPGLSRCLSRSLHLSVFVPGQRWISDTEPELGLGTVLDADSSRVTILYIASSERRTYARNNAPLTRVRFAPGDTVESVDGWKIKVSAVEERDAIITYVGDDRRNKQRRLEEIELNHFLQFNRPQERLLGGQIDPASLFRLRIDTLRQLGELEQSPIRGLLGPRTSLIPHQLYIAHEVASRHAPRVLLADEVGLGKTIEAGLVLHHQLLTGRAERVLLIVPESLLHQWLVEMRRRFNLRFSLFDQGRDWQSDAPNPYLEEQLILCSLEFLMEDSGRQDRAIEAGWDLCVVDEAHHLRYTPEQSSPEYRFVERLARVSPGLLLLTATPEQWGKASHFARLRLLDPDRFHDFERFQQEERDYESLAEVINHLLDQETLDARTLRRLQGFLTHDRADELVARLDDPQSTEEARRTLIQVLLDRHGTGRVLFRNTRATVRGFPERRLHAFPLPLCDRYRTALQQDRIGLEAHLYPESLCYDPLESRGEWWRFDARVAWLIAFLKDRQSAKVLVICAKAHTATDLENALRVLGGTRAAVFHEGMTIVARDRAAAWFAEEEEGAQVLVCSEIGSEGRNFQFAHHLVLFDLPLNPDVLEQRIGRLDRIGQTATIEIHVPYFAGSAQETLYRWYAEGLDAFSHPCPAGQMVLGEVSRELSEALAGVDSEELDALLQRTRALNAGLLEDLHRGRDRLLELNSCRAEAARELTVGIEKYDRDSFLWSYLERVFDAYGVNVEDHSDDCFILMPSEHLRIPHFPELPEDGATVTTDRSLALAREDMLFLTWEHPLVRSAMDLLLNSEHGNAALSLAQHPDLAPGQLLVETFYLLEAPAPAHLQVGRFLPPTLIRVLLDGKGNELTLESDAFIEQRGSFPPDDIRNLMRAHRQLLQELLKRAEQTVRTQLPRLAAEGQTRMLDFMTAELKRLAALRRINPAVRQEELDRLKEEGLELHNFLHSAQLRLDALRVIITV